MELNPSRIKVIPKTIHSIWLGGEPPDQIKRFTSDMRRMNEAAGFTYTLHRNELLDRYADDIYVKYLQSAGEKVAFLADRLRLLLLRDEGGIYIDADAKPVRPFSLLNGLWESSHITFAYGHRNPWRPGVAIHRGEIPFVDNTFLASTPNSKMIRELLSLYTPNSKIVNGADIGKNILLRTDWTCADTGIEPFYSMQDTPRTICLHDSINLGSWVEPEQKKIGFTRPWAST